MRDLESPALELPETTRELDAGGLPRYLVDGTWFCFHREPRKDALLDSCARLLRFPARACACSSVFLRG